MKNIELDLTKVLSSEVIKTLKPLIPEKFDLVEGAPESVRVSLVDAGAPATISFDYESKRHDLIVYTSHSQSEPNAETCDHEYKNPEKITIQGSKGKFKDSSLYLTFQTSDTCAVWVSLNFTH